MKSNLIKIGALLWLLSAAFHASAASPPGIGEVLHQATPAAEPPAKAEPLPKVQGAPTEEAPMKALPGEQPTIAVRDVRFTGNGVFSSEELRRLVQDAIGQQQTVAELHQVATRITRFYRNAGYFVARAYVPAQEIVDGTVTIRIIEGHYGNFNLDHHGRLKKETAQAILDAAKDRDIVAIDTLERAMLVLNDTPGVHVTQVSVSPGEKVGTSDFNVATEATPQFIGTAVMDNYGSTYTGKNRVGFAGAWDGVTGNGDRLDLSALGTGDGGLASGRLGYWRLLTPSGLRGEVALSRTTYSLGGVYSSLDAVGQATGASGQLTYPLILSEAQRLTASVGASYTDLVDEIRSTGTRQPKNIASVVGGLEYVSRGTDVAMQAGASLTIGSLDIRDADAKAADAAGASSDGSFSKLGLHLERRQLLGKDFQFDLRLRAQTYLSGGSLDGSQKISVSGSDGVSVYAPGELLGDSGATVRLALSRSFQVTEAIRLTPSVFIDEGWARNRYVIAGFPRERGLGDVGLGMAVTHKSATLSLQWVRRTHGGDALSESTSKSRVLAQLAVGF